MEDMEKMAKNKGNEELQFQENRVLGKQFARAFIPVLFEVGTASSGQ